MNQNTSVNTSTDLTRRKFVAAVLAGGITSAVAAPGARAADFPADAGNCDDINASAADAVLLYATLLRDIESSELRNLGENMSRALGEFSQAFNEVFRLAGRLERAVCKEQAGRADAQKIKGLAEAGRAGLAAGGPSGGAAGAQVMFVKVICDQMDSAARCMLSPSDRCLSKEAADLVNQILAQIRRVRDLQAVADVAREEWVRSARDIGARIWSTADALT